MTSVNPVLSEEHLRQIIDQYSEKGVKIPQFSQDTVEALYAFGFGFYQHGKFDQAVHFFRFLTLIDFNQRKHWMGLGASYQMLKDYARAIQCFGYAAMLNPSDPYAHFHAAECFLSLKETEKAKEALKSAETVAKKAPKKHETLLARIALLKPRRKSS